MGPLKQIYHQSSFPRHTSQFPGVGARLISFHKAKLCKTNEAECLFFRMFRMDTEVPKGKPGSQCFKEYLSASTFVDFPYLQEPQLDLIEGK